MSIVSNLVDLATSFGYAGFAIAMFANTAIGFPPSEVLSLAVGVLAAQGKLRLPLSIGICSFSNTAGTLVWFIIARRRPDRIVRWVTDLQSKSGRLLGLFGWSSRVLNIVDNLFQKHKAFFVIAGRNVPVIRSVISIPAGRSGMSLFKFIICTQIGVTIWISIWVMVGYNVGEEPAAPISLAIILVAFLVASGIGILVGKYGSLRQ